MIYSKVTTQDSGGAEFTAFLKTLKKQAHSYVTIGIHEDAGKYTDGKNPPMVGEVSLWNEFGAKKGQPDEIPERSFVRSAIDENEPKLRQWREDMVANILHKGWSITKALESMGLRIQLLIQNKIKSNVPPKNAPSTVDAKNRTAPANANRTLMESELLLRSVHYKVFVK